MSGRNLTNGGGFTHRNLTNIAVNQLSDISADLPIVYNSDFKISLKGLSTLGSAGQILKMNSGGTALEYATDNTRTDSEIRALFSSAGNPITYNNSTGVIGWTNSNNYITLTSLSASSPLSYDNSSGAFTTTFTASSTDTLTNKSGNISMFSNNENYIKLTSLSASSPLSYNNSSGAFTTTFTASSTDTLTNKSISYDQLTGTPTIPTTYWNLDSVSLTPKLDTYNLIIGDEDNANSNNVELLVYGDMELKQTLFSTNNAQNKIDFDTTYGIDFYGYYYSPSLRSYNMSFRNNTHGSNFPYIGVSNTGDMIFHQNGRGDVMTMKADATRDVLITAGDLIGNYASNYSKNRMKDVYCRNIYSEPIEIKNGTTSSGYISLYENSTNGNSYINLIAPSSLGSSITVELPSTAGTLLNTAVNQTLNYPLFTKITGDNPVFAMRDEDLSNWIYMKTPALSSDITITFPSSTGTLALQSEIPTNNNQLTNGASYITSSAISSFITATSTETLENKTLKSPIFTSQSGAYEKMILKDENLTHNINVFTPDLTDNINVSFPSATGTLAITDDIHTTAEIRALFSSAGNPITYSNGVIGWTNSENYITNADVLSQIASATSISTSSILGNPSRTFGNSLCANTINGTSTTINNLIATGTSGDNARLTLKDNNLDHNAIIKCLNFTQDRTFYFIDDGGSILTSSNTSASHIRGLFSGDTPISVNTSTGAISTTFTPTSTTNISGKTITDELLVSPTNTSSFYIAKLLASSLSSGYVEMVLGKANTAFNTSCYAYYHSSDGSTSNYLQIGMKTKETMLQLKADTNIIMNSNKVDIITPNGTDNCNLILSAGYNPSGSGAGNSAVIQLQNTNSVGTVKKAQLFLNGADDYLVLKNLQGDARIEMVIGSVVASIFEGAYTTINNDLKVNKILARSQTNNIIESNSTYGWEINGNNSSYSFALKNGTSNFMYLGSPSSSIPFNQHINGVGDSYNVTNGRAHNFVGEYLTANSTSLGGSAEAMGFTTYLASSYTSSKFPTVATNGQYLYFSIYNNLGTRTGGTYCGYVGSSGFVDISDKRFKKDITTIANPFNIINNIRGVSFKWNEESGKEDGKEHIGFIAQELNEVLPQVCNYDEKTDSWGIYKADVNAVLVEAVKELKKQVEQQQIIIDKLLKSKTYKDFKS